MAVDAQSRRLLPSTPMRGRPGLGTPIGLHAALIFAQRAVGEKESPGILDPDSRLVSHHPHRRHRAVHWGHSNSRGQSWALVVAHAIAFSAVM